jgi:hypothetical protein
MLGKHEAHAAGQWPGRCGILADGNCAHQGLADLRSGAVMSNARVRRQGGWEASDRDTACASVCRPRQTLSSSTSMPK